MKETTKTIVFVSGANRGIGYELASQMARSGFRVVAGYRDEARSSQLLAEAQKYPTLSPLPVDVTSEADLVRLRDFVANNFGRIDILINNAAVNLAAGRDLLEVEWKDIAANFGVNVGGPFLATRYLHPLLLAGHAKKIVNISSKMGSISLSGADAVPYRISKAALNMLTRNLSEWYRSAGVTVVSVHPGWVRTDMGGQAAPLSSEDSAHRILGIIDRITIPDSGKFLDLDGATLPF